MERARGESQRPHLGFIGLGAMGAAIVRRLLAAGYEVTGWNRSPARAEPLVQEGMRRAETPAGVAAAADIIFSIVTDSAALEDVVTGTSGLITALGPGKLFLDMSTVSPDASRRLAARVAETGAEMLDAPISASIATLEQGQASLMVGGSATAFERAEPVLRAIGPKVTHIGGNGLALYVKLAINLALVVQVVAYCEGVAMAEKAGVDREVAVDAFLKSVVASPVLGYRGPFIIEGRMPEVAWADVHLQQKDLLLALDVGRRLGVALPLTGVANEMLNACHGMGIDDKDFVIVYEVYRSLAGMRA